MKPSKDLHSSTTAALFAAIDKLNERLDRLEQGSGERPIMPTLHPSVEKFSLAEAIVDELFASAENQKACTFEPNDKPCDHCSMCSSRGF